MTESKGHIAFFNGWEYFYGPAGHVYRAPKRNPLDTYGYRMGARFESQAGVWEEWESRGMLPWQSEEAMRENPDASLWTMDDIAELFDLYTYDEIDEYNVDYIADVGMQAYDDAIDDDATDEEADDARNEAEMEASDEVFRFWHNGVMAAAEEAFDHVGLILDPVSDDDYPWEFKLKPETSWKNAADGILDLINGVGIFYFGSLNEFLDSGPYTPKEAVLEHIGYLPRYYEIYGGSASMAYERAWR